MALSAPSNEIADLGALVAGMSPPDLERFASSLSETDLALLREALAHQRAQRWRTDPAAMAEHLTNGRYKRWRYIRLLSEHFRLAVQSPDPRWKRQIWSLPSRLGKTLLASNWGPVWALDHNPRMKLILTSYSDSLALENAVFVRDALEEHADVLRTTLRRDRRRLDRFVTEEGGGVLGAGLNSTMTGFGAGSNGGDGDGGIVIDDPYKGWPEAHRESVRKYVSTRYRTVVRRRLDDESAFIILVHARMHRDDLSGELLQTALEDSEQEQWVHVRLPALAEAHDPASPDPLLRVPDPLGREPGEPIEPERMSLKEARSRIVLSSYLAAALEQQRPAPEEGGELKRGWWRWETALPPVLEETISSWDPKLRNRERGDHVVGQVWGRVGADFYLVEMMRRQFTLASTKMAIALLAVRHPDISRHYIENTGNAPEVMEELRRGDKDFVVSAKQAGLLGMTEAEREAVQRVMRRGMGGLIPVSPKGSKVTRVRAISGLVETGHVHLLQGDRNALFLVDECVTLNTVIFTRQGLVEAGSVKVGDEVLTHRGRFRPVLAVRRRHAPETVEITAKTLDPLRVTPDHPVLSMRMSNASEPGGKYAQRIEWRAAGDLSARTMKMSRRGEIEPSPNASDALTFPVLDEDYELEEIDLRFWYDFPPATPIPGRRAFTVTDDGECLLLNATRAQPLRYRQPLDYRFGRFCGLWLAEGSFSSGPGGNSLTGRRYPAWGRAQWSFNKAETDLIDEVRMTLKERLGANSSTAIRKASPNCLVITANLIRLERWFSTFGHRASGKRIPAWAWAAPKEFHQGIIEGWLDGDGHAGRGTTVSPHLAWGIRLLSTRNGIWPKFTKTAPRPSPGINSRHAQYTVDTQAKSRTTEVWADDDGDRLLGFWVRSSTLAGEAEVVNFHVEEDESYVTTGGTVHNCATFPDGANDDTVDCFSQAISRLSRSGASVSAPSGHRPTPPVGASPQTVQPRRPTAKRGSIRMPVGRGRSALG